MTVMYRLVAMEDFTDWAAVAIAGLALLLSLISFWLRQSDRRRQQSSLVSAWFAEELPQKGVSWDGEPETRKVRSGLALFNQSAAPITNVRITGRGPGGKPVAHSLQFLPPGAFIIREPWKKGRLPLVVDPSHLRPYGAIARCLYLQFRHYGHCCGRTLCSSAG